MTDDLVVGGILPIDDSTQTDAEFDPDAVESDVFLEDPKDEILLGDDLADLTSSDDDELLEVDV